RAFLHVDADRGGNTEEQAHQPSEARCERCATPATTPERSYDNQAEALPQIGADIGPGNRLFRFRCLSYAAAIEIVCAHRDQEHAHGCNCEDDNYEPAHEAASFGRHHMNLHTLRRPTSSGGERIGTPGLDDGSSSNTKRSAVWVASK